MTSNDKKQSGAQYRFLNSVASLISPMQNLPPASKTLLSGGIAGIVSRTLVSPLERLKMIFQTQSSPPKYMGIFQAIGLIVREEGVRGLFKGNGANCIRIFPTSAFQFYFYEMFKSLTLHYIKKGQGELNPHDRLVLGGLSGICTLAIFYPLEFVRCRLALQTDRTYRGIMHCLWTVSRREGPLAIYAGIWPSILGVVPYVGVDFAVYDTLKQYTSQFQNRSSGGVIILLNGAIAGTVAQTATYPLDLIRRRFQIQNFSSTIIGHTQHYNSVADAFRKIYNRGGLLGFYPGLFVNSVKVVPSVAISFFVYEHMKFLLRLT